jgi:hypothetical protein
MPNQDALDSIQVKNPCPAAWDEMAGDDRRRFCAHCGKYVHNVTAMPRDEAERLVCASAGELCVRFARDPRTSELITLNYRPKPPASRRRAVMVVSSILAALGLSGSWFAVKLLAKPAPPPTPIKFIAGAIAPLRVPAPAPPMSQTK